MRNLNSKTKMRLMSVVTVFIGLMSMQATDFLSELHEKYVRFTEKNPSVKLNLVFNQPSYALGDTAFFSAWYVDDSFRAIKGDFIVTLDIVGGDGATYQRSRFKVQNGRGANQIKIGESIPPGLYKMVAYTGWMKNFGVGSFFQRSIQIANRNEIRTTNSDPIFATEGGNWVAGIPNTVSVVGAPGTEWIVRDQQQAEVKRVSLDSTGVANFSFTPVSGQTYSAHNASLKKVVPLPAAQSDGIAVQLEGDLHSLTLMAPANSKWINEKIYAIVIAKGKIISENELAISKEGARATMAVPNAESGLNQLFVFDAKGNVLAQRVFALPIQTGVEASLQFPAGVQQRETVNGAITIQDKVRNQPVSDFTVTVFQKNLFPRSGHWADPHYWDLPALVNYISDYGNPSVQRLNQFLISQKWERINWENVLADKPKPLANAFQSQTALIGEVTSKANGSEPPDSTVLLTYLQRNTIGYEAVVEKGKFKVPFIFDFYGDDQVFCTLQSRARVLDGEYRIIIRDDSVNLPDRWQSTETDNVSLHGDYSFKRQLVTKSYSFFSKKDVAQVVNESPNRFFEDEFFGVDFTVNVQDYLIFPKMEELLREIVPFVQHRRRGQTETVRMLFRFDTSTKLAKSDPLYIIDGIMSRNTAYFLSLKPEDILYIKVLNEPNKLQQLGKLGENGIVFVESKKGVSSMGTFERNVFDVVGLSKSVKFPYNEQYHFNAEGRVPDLRSTLYWSPATKSDRAGKAAITFSTSDDVGPAIIRVEGFTEDGRPFSAQQEVQVNFAGTAKN